MKVGMILLQNGFQSNVVIMAGGFKKGVYYSMTLVLEYQYWVYKTEKWLGLKEILLFLVSIGSPV